MNTIRSLVVLLLLSPLLQAQAPKTKTGVEVEMQLAFVSNQEMDKLVRENPKLINISNKGIVNFELMTPADLQKLIVDLVANGENRVIALPKQSVADGRTAKVQNGEARARTTITTTVDKADGKEVTKPGVEWLFVGQTISVTPKVATDKKAVELVLGYNSTTLGEVTVKISTSAKVPPKAGEKAKEEDVENKGEYKAVTINSTGYETTLKLAASTCLVKEMDIQKQGNSGKRQSVLLFMTTKVVEIPESAALANDSNNTVALGKFDEAQKSTAKLAVYPTFSPNVSPKNR